MTDSDTSPTGGTGNLSRDRGSQTAESVAAGRADHYLSGRRPLIVEDPFAVHFLGPRWAGAVRSRFKRWLVRRKLGDLMRTATFVLTRARTADDVTLDAARRGVKQLVILGAGFDTFGLRHPEEGIEVFEVDLAATSQLKKKQLAAADVAIPPCVRFVEVDFERDDLSAKLTDSGFDPSAPAVFSFVGVTYYLEAAAVRETLRLTTRLAAPGSELVLDFRRPRETLASPEDQRHFDRVEAFVLEHGEPQVSTVDPEEPAEDLGLSAEWEVLANYSPQDLQDRFVAGRKDVLPISALFHILHLRRKGG